MQIASSPWLLKDEMHAFHDRNALMKSIITSDDQDAGIHHYYTSFT